MAKSRFILLWVIFIPALFIAAPAHGAQWNTPVPPLTAWEVAPDGAVYVFDAAQHVHELDPVTLAPRKQSERLASTFSAGAAQIVADADRLYVIGHQIEGVQVLDRETLVVVDSLPVDAAALAVEPDERLFVIQRLPLPAVLGFYTFAVGYLPLDDLQGTPQPFAATEALPAGVVATQPFGSLFDLVVDAEAGLLYVGYLDTGGSPNRHFRTYRAYDLATGAEVDLGLERQAASTALRPALAEGSTTAISFAWEGIFPQQERIYLVGRDEEPQTVEGLSGPLALNAGGEWLYVAAERGLWVLEADENDGYALRSVIPFLQAAPEAIRTSPDGDTIYLFGNGWLSALAAADLQGAGVTPFAPLPTAWTNAANPNAQTPRLFRAAGDGAVVPDAEPYRDVALLNLQPSNEWYRSVDGGTSWQLLPQVQYPQNVGLDRLSLSPSMAEDGTVVGRGAWQGDTRTLWRSLDAGSTWERWAPPIAFVAGREGARTLYVAESTGANARSVPVGGSSENPAWSPGWTHLAYQNNLTGDWEIYRVDAHCSTPEGPSAAAETCDVRQLTDSAGEDLLPAWSPDGRYIAFVSLRDGNPEIYVMLADGSQQTRLTSSPGGDWRPAWLPDSRHLVFTSNRNGSNDIFLMEVPSTLGSEMTHEPSVTPVIASPADERDGAINGDGELLFLSDRNGVMQPFAADLQQFSAGSSRTPLTGAPVLEGVDTPIGHPTWLPSGDLLFAAGDRLYTAARGNGPDAWRVVTEAGDAAQHPTGGSPWYWPQPFAGPVSLRP